MKVWRGIFDNGRMRREDLGKFNRLPPDHLEWPEVIAAKILDNLETVPHPEKLTSFSRKREIALRFCGPRGWLLECEVGIAFLVSGEEQMERAMNNCPPASDHWRRFREARAMAANDEEWFLKADGECAIVTTYSTGSFPSGLRLGGDIKG